MPRNRYAKQIRKVERKQIERQEKELAAILKERLSAIEEIEGLVAFYDALCDRTEAARCMSVTDYAVANR